MPKIHELSDNPTTVLLAGGLEAEEAPTAFTWRSITRKQFMHLYEWTTPEAVRYFAGGFCALSGDCENHRICTVTRKFDENGTFAAIVERKSQYFHCIQPMTVAEFQAINPATIEVVELNS